MKYTINEHFLKTFSPIPKNYDLAEIWPYVTMAEKLYIIPIIGQDLYDEILEQVNAPSGGTLSEENSTLLTTGCLWQLLGFATVYEALPLIWGTLSESGLQLEKSEMSDSMTLKDITLVQQHLQNQINGLRKVVITYLCTHTESFPLFDTSICGCGCECGKNNPKQLFKPLAPTIRQHKNIC